MAVSSLQRQSLFREIQTQIREYVLSKHLQPGDLLPPAGELAEQLGVSMGTLRESLRALEALGVLEIVHGVGTFVRAYDLTPILENLSFSLLFEQDNLRDLVQVREAMEAGLLPAVVANISESDLVELESIVDRMAMPGDSTKEDYEFHCTLYRCLNNSLVIQFIDIFWLVYHDLTARLLVQHKRILNRHATHAPILEALQARDADRAVTALRVHFDEIKTRITDSESAHS